MLRWITIFTIALATFGCDRSKDATPPDAAEGNSAAAEAESEEEAEEPAAAPDETCAQAYSDLEELVKGLEEQLGPSDAGMPDRTEFIEKCKTLPADVQKCMVFEYGMANKDACEERVSALDPDEQKRAQELMGK